MEKIAKFRPVTLVYGEPCKSLTINIFEKNLSEFEILPQGFTELEVPTALRILADILETKYSKEAINECSKLPEEKAKEMAERG